MKKKIVIPISVLLIIILMILGMFIFNYPTTQTMYYEDNEMGLVKTQITVYNKWNKWMGVFQQLAAFQTNEAKVGDKVTVIDEYTYDATDTGNPDTQCFLVDIEVEVIEPDGNHDFIGHRGYYNDPQPDGISITTEVFYTTWKEGTFTLQSNYYQSECDLNGEYCEEESDNCPVLGESGDSSLLVLPADCVFNGWVNYEDIDNGEVLKREDNCNNIEYKTVCVEGYQITDTEGLTEGTGQLTCEEITGEVCDIDDDCDGMICDVDDKVCVDYECEDNSILEKNCEDGVNITTHTCEGNRLKETDEVCDEDSNDTSVCWKQSPTTQQTALSDELCVSETISGDDCKSPYFDSEDKCVDSLDKGINWLMIILGVVVVIMLIVIGIVIYVRVRK